MIQSKMKNESGGGDGSWLLQNLKKKKSSLSNLILTILSPWSLQCVREKKKKRNWGIFGGFVFHWNLPHPNLKQLRHIGMEKIIWNYKSNRMLRGKNWISSWIQIKYRMSFDLFVVLHLFICSIYSLNIEISE